jgi:hypothetical protein
MEQISSRLSTTMRALLVCLWIIGLTVSAASEEFLLSPPAQKGPVVVQAHFELNNLNQINDEENTFEFTGVLTLKWHDPRQAFDPAVAGVNEKIFQGDYQFNELSPGWYPQLVLVNESSGLYQEDGVVLRVLADGTSTLIQTLNANAEIKLDLRRFPFDKHQLEAVFEVLGFDKDEVILQTQSESSFLVSKFRLPQWTLTDVRTYVRDRPADYAGALGVSSALVVGVDVERKPFFVARLVIIPLIVIVLLSISVFWMDRSSLGDRLNVSFIGILTGVAYLLVTSEQLPRISYFTLIHGFLNLSYLTMCATVVINLVVGTLDKRGKIELGDRVDSVCRWLFPLIYFALLLIMFVAANIFY